MGFGNPSLPERANGQEPDQIDGGSYKEKEYGRNGEPPPTEQEAEKETTDADESKATGPADQVAICFLDTGHVAFSAAACAMLAALAHATLGLIASASRPRPNGSEFCCTACPVANR